MNHKEIQELIKLINKTNISEFKLRNGDFEVVVRTKDYHKGKPGSAAPQQVIPLSAPAPVTPITNYSPPPTVPKEQPSIKPVIEPSSKDNSDKKENAYLEIKSPIVGTFYRAASPEKPPYIKVGDRVEVGTVVCMVEAMKLFNEIEAELSGVIVKVLLEDASPVEYDQPLFLVDPKG